MNWTWWPTLVATGVNDEVVQMAREAMMRHLRVAVGKLKEYLKLYDEYLPLLRLDVAKYVEETRRRDPEEEEGRLAAYLAEIAEHETQLARVEEMVPRRIVVGCFHVDVSEVRKALWEKRAELAEKVRQLVAEFPRKITDAVNKEYQELHAKLQVPSEDPEGLQALGDLIESVRNSCWSRASRWRIPIRITTRCRRCSATCRTKITN